MPENSLILVVDDEATFREIFKTKLTAAGYRVETAENGKEGIKKANELMPDLILMDVKMPEMDGTDAAQALHDDPATRDIKIVFLTSLGDPEQDIQERDRDMVKGMGFQGYIKKTDDLETLASKVEAFVTGGAK